MSEFVEDHGLVWWLQLIQKVCFAKLIRKTDLTIKLNSCQQNCNASQCDEKLPMNIWSCKSSCFEVQAFSRLTHQSKARHTIILSFRFQTYHYPHFERISQIWKDFHKKCEYFPRASMNFHSLSVKPFIEPKEGRKRQQIHSRRDNGNDTSFRSVPLCVAIQSNRSRVYKLVNRLSKQRFLDSLCCG